MQALQSRCFCVGALGSRATSAARRERLLELDLSPQQIERLHAPVGVDIGSRTPAEIALSIMAGITAQRRRITTR
jgi:xanthine dehydrogenase accessory factor